MAPRGRVPIPTEQRLRTKIREDESGCWIWQGTIDVGGYGRIWVGSRPLNNRRSALAHRVSYETFVGPIPDGLTLDHLCRVRTCVNPAHLEPVTVAENTARAPGVPSTLNRTKTHCPRGHQYTPDNTYLGPSSGKRYCLACREARRDRPIPGPEDPRHGKGSNLYTNYGCRCEPCRAGNRAAAARRRESAA